MENEKIQSEKEVRTERDSLMKAIHLKILAMPESTKEEIMFNLNKYLT